MKYFVGICPLCIPVEASTSAEKTHKLKPLEEFDPRPTEFRNTAHDQLVDVLSSVRGKGLCVSLMFDTECRYWDANLIVVLSHLHPFSLAKKNYKRRFKNLKKPQYFCPENSKD